MARIPSQVDYNCQMKPSPSRLCPYSISEWTARKAPAPRTASPPGMRPPMVDVAIIGGGIQGAGIAREAALRGLTVALFEKGDFGSGTSSRTSGLIHGGIRYLEQGEIGLVREAVRERQILLRIAPHLVRPLPFLFPFYRGDRRGHWTLRVGMTIYDLLAGFGGIGRHQMLSPDAVHACEPQLRSEGLLGAARFYDAQMDDARLCLAVIRSAQTLGAAVFRDTPVVGLLREGAAVCGVTVSETVSGKQYDIPARVVVNAAGPWVDTVCKMAGDETRRLRPTKGIHILYPQVTRQAIVVQDARNRRIFFVIPWEVQSLIGTTDTDYPGDPDAVCAEPAEVNDLLSAVGGLFPSVDFSPERVISTYAGIRPLVGSKEGLASESDLSREGALSWTAGGMLVVVGGKYTLFRKTAERAVDLLAKRHSFAIADRPATEPPLFGGEMTSFPTYLETALPLAMKKYNVTSDCAKRLIGRYGTAHDDVLRTLVDHPALATPLLPSGEHIAAEVAYAIYDEAAIHLQDVWQRRLGRARGPLGNDPALREYVGRLMGEICGWDAARLAQEQDAATGRRSAGVH